MRITAKTMLRASGRALSVLTSSLMASAIGGAAMAAEGGRSHYLPDAVGDIFLAVPPEPGAQIADVSWFQSGQLNQALLEGQVGLGHEADTFINLTSLTYTFQ